jgi:hypothetical protein
MSKDRPTPLPSFATVPPPGGTLDEYSAPTTVAELPDSFLDELKAATREEAAARAAGRDLKATRKNPSFDLELREKLTAKLVDVPSVSEPNAAASTFAPAVTPEASDAAPATKAASAESAESDDEPSDVIAPGSVDRGRDFLMTLLALFAAAAIAWTYYAHLR